MGIAPRCFYAAAYSGMGGQRSHAHPKPFSTPLLNADVFDVCLIPTLLVALFYQLSIPTLIRSIRVSHFFAAV